MKSKAYVKFLNRAAHFEADMELADALSRLASQMQPAGNKLLPTVDEERHPRLSKRKGNAASRKQACGHLHTTLRSAYLKDMYEELGHYMTEILRSAAAKGVDGRRLVGSHPFSIEANVLLSLGSWEAVLNLFSRELFRKIESDRSTLKLITNFGAKLNLGFDSAIVDAALPYLELRHILVHRDGIVDRDFAAKHPQLGLRDGDEFSLAYADMLKARNAISTLVEHIDAKIVENNVILNSDLQP